jgi:hypothetical protein
VKAECTDPGFGVAPETRQNVAFHSMKDASVLSNSILLNKGKKRFSLYCSENYIIES